MVAGVVSGESIKAGVLVCLGHCCLPGAVSSAWHIVMANLSPPASASRPSSPPVLCMEPPPLLSCHPRAVRTPPLFWVVLTLFSPLNLFSSSSLSNHILPIGLHLRSRSSTVISTGPQGPGFHSLPGPHHHVLSQGLAEFFQSIIRDVIGPHGVGA